ncbi:hypothetical protein HanRHA438_Chr11g0500341 [Helianthus annuus]|nr:hypothetical protein HanHA300_Chr11g0399491 [Helianthus annuus]KAJ0517228.1 hypothetical protein HanHA89_Chr11g0422971 [Helianthus annuus]KAJ0870426.1 hypothetical protein HanRHA438_Chr11g0500341 [Helianthus annuus]
MSFLYLSPHLYCQNSFSLSTFLKTHLSISLLLFKKPFQFLKPHCLSTGRLPTPIFRRNPPHLQPPFIIPPHIHKLVNTAERERGTCGEKERESDERERELSERNGVVVLFWG